MAEIRYLTMDGEPPNGGMPPNLGTFAHAPQPQFPAPGFPMFVPGPPSQAPVEQAPLQGFFGPAFFPPAFPANMFAVQPQQAQQFGMQEFAFNPGPPAPPGPNYQNPHGGIMPGTTDQPLVLPGGHGYIFPPHNTTIHLFRCTTHYPWDSHDGIFDFVTYQAPTNMTVADLIRQICPQGDAIRGRGLIECQQEVFGGTTRFTRGQEYFIGEGKGEAAAMQEMVGKTLTEVGWNEHRRANANPVWLASSLSLQ
ncbi:conserved hypothetical protein [Histoplasma capsulatum var. duboisii H88]|uniref:Uncharacterized protein n=2 Tax=Ajellomyces capsulatus TaxID=5037 RepID=F0U6G6_AJEC8|nr:conserved hypothetical protein [Histoplasma capsulatum H143]EGC42294.1 conserved hypothetical protein [Histoplasma capsulatum var. duboisii H88]QSS51298.1 hypothetical protein I7I53_06586 [Histoplasma capsulatum var. duboisii H88]